LNATIERNLDEREGLRTRRPQLFSKPFFFQERGTRASNSAGLSIMRIEENVVAASGGNESHAPNDT